MLDASNVKLGASVFASFAGTFAVGGVDATGARLLDLEVLAPAWTYNAGDGSWTSTARSQRG